MADEANTLPDGYLSMEGGVDSGFVPNLLKENEYSWAINTTCRGGYWKPRPGLRYRQLLFPSPTVEANFAEGLFQGAGTYVTDDDAGYLVASVSGRIFSIPLDTFTVADISIPGDLNSPTARHSWFQQAENTLVVQNMLQAPLFWNGVSSRRSIINKQVPVGGPMAYLKGRLWVARGANFFGGDLVNSYPSLGRESVLQYEENTFLDEGGAFTAGRKITAMAVGANINTALGDGDLLVFTRSTTFSFNAPADRTAWKDLQYPIQRIALLNAGATSQESVVVLNSDLLFRSNNGVNSFRYSQNDFAEWGNTAISRQAERAFKWDTDSRLTECSAVNFDNRMLMTCHPVFMPGHGMIHRGLAVLDYHLVSGMGRKTNPAWEGVWTGLKVLRILTIEHRSVTRCFIFALDDENKITLWEQTKDAYFDIGPDGEDTRITWGPETKSFTYGRPRQIKKLLSLEQWYDQLTGQLDVAFQFRPNLMECWTEWAGWSDCAKYKECDPPAEGDECSPVKFLRQQVRSRMALPAPPDVVDVQSGGFRNIGYEFQFRIILIGYARLNRLVTTAGLVGDDVLGDMRNVTCPDTQVGECATGDCAELACCDPDDFTYSVGAVAVGAGYITGRVFVREEVPAPTGDQYVIWHGRVGMDAAGTWVTDEASLQIPQFLFWGGLETDKLDTVTQEEIDGVFPYTSVVGGAISDIVYGATKALTAPPWADTLNVQQFNPNVLGGPVSVDIDLDIITRSQPRAENLDLVAAQTITAGLTGTATVQYPSTNPLLNISSTAQVVEGLQAYDGVTDYAGASGFVTDPPVSAGDSVSTNVTSASPDWSSMLGSGTTLFPATGTVVEIASSAPGPTDLANDDDSPGVSAEITTTWHYHPVEGYWMFAIDDAAAWSPTSFKLSDNSDLIMADLADLGGPAGNRGEINGFGYEQVQDFGAGIFKLFRSKFQVPAGGDTVTVAGTGNEPDPPTIIDTALGGVEVLLFNDTDDDGVPDGASIATSTTDMNGAYGFANLPAGSYVVQAVIVAPYESVLDVDSTVDSPALPADASNVSPTDALIPVTLAASETDSGNDFYVQDTSGYVQIDGLGSVPVGQQGTEAVQIDGLGSSVIGASGEEAVQIDGLGIVVVGASGGASEEAVQFDGIGVVVITMET